LTAAGQLDDTADSLAGELVLPPLLAEGLPELQADSTSNPDMNSATNAP
jgi:hypothetical protein